MITLFIVLLIVEVLVLSALVHTNHGGWGLLSLAVAAGVYILLGGTATLAGLWSAIVTAPLFAIATVLVYLVAGVLWSFFKYYSYIREQKRNGVSKSTLANANNTDRVVTWMGYWPISIMTHILGDGVYKLFIWIYDHVKSVYGKILDGVYGETPKV